MKTFLCFVPVIAILWNAIDLALHMWPWYVVMLLIFGITGSTMAFFVRHTAIAAASGILILASYLVPFFHLRITSLLFMSLSNPIFLCIPITGGVVLAAAFMIHTDKASPKLRVLFLLPAATLVSVMILSPGIFFSRDVLVIILFFTGIAACTVTGFIRYLRNSSVPDDATEPTNTYDFSDPERNARNAWKMILGFLSFFLLFFLLSYLVTSVHDNINHTGEYAYVDLISTWMPPEPLGLENWIDHAADGFAGGAGTEEDPYLISTPGQLAYLAKRVNAGTNWNLRTHFKISNDIDLAGKEWTPIGTRRRPFIGVLDGGDAVIYNLTIASSKDFQGLVGYMRGEDFLSGVLRNLTLVNVDVKGRNFVGGLVGAGRAFIFNSSVVGGTVEGRNAVGGLIGHGHSGIIYSYYSGRVKGHTYVGGLAGRFGRPVSGFMFGLPGASVAPLPTLLEASSATGVVSGVKYVGGISGFDGMGTNISHNLFAGKVKGEVFYAAINNIRRSSFSRGSGNFAFLHEMTGTEFHDRRNAILGRKDDGWYRNVGNGILQLPTSEAENAFLQDIISSNYLTESMLDRLPPSFRVLNIPHRMMIPHNIPLLLDLGEEGYSLLARGFSGLFFAVNGSFLETSVWHEARTRSSLPRGVYVIPCFRNVDGSYEVIWVLLNVI